MKKLNNKGISIVEILLCFVLVIGVTFSLFSSLNNYKEKQQLESDRNTIVTYKNLLTKEIQDDLIMKGIKEVTNSSTSANDHSIQYNIDITLNNGEQKELIIIKNLAAYEEDEEVITDQDDYFMIQYGDKGNTIKYPIPNLGSTKNQNDKTVYDLKINNIDINTQNNILTIYIGLYHPDFGKRYAIDIVCPINYQ